MKRGSLIWETSRDNEQLIPLIFRHDDKLDEDVVYWSLGEYTHVFFSFARSAPYPEGTHTNTPVDALISPFIFAKTTVMKIHNYVVKDMRKVRTIVDSSHVLVHQYDLELVFDELALRNMIPVEVQLIIMNFLADVPTPTKKEQSFTQLVSLKGKEEEEPYVSLSGEDDEEEEEEALEGLEHHKKRSRSAPEGLEEDDDDIMDQVLMTTRLIDTLLPVLDRPGQDIIPDDRERGDLALFLRNLIRSIPRQKILRVCNGEDGDDEPVDDSPVTNVTQRAIDLGYNLPPANTPEGQRMRMDIGYLAVKYYKEENGGRYPPQFYQTLEGGTRVLVNKWTLNNCRNTLDRAIHIILQK